MSDPGLTRGEVVGVLVRLAALSAISYYTAKWMIDLLDPTRKEKQRAQAKAKKLLLELGISSKDVSLNEYEMTLASNLVRPEAMGTTWADIAGLDEVVTELRETVILPIRRRQLLAGSRLTQAPKGVLLHGPPGCGKTMIARATAREAGARFINLDGAAIQDKWYGESQKLVGALFSLARKLQPTIIFIDEIDSLLRMRDSRDHEATAMIKAQFMQLWDGLSAEAEGAEFNSATVVVMGATNRPKDVDRAILRRMPATFHVGLPDYNQRKAILGQILKMEPKLSDDVDFNRLAKLSEK